MSKTCGFWSLILTWISLWDHRSPTSPPPRPTWVHLQLWDNPPLQTLPSSNTGIFPPCLVDFSGTWELAEPLVGSVECVGIHDHRATLRHYRPQLPWLLVGLLTGELHTLSKAPNGLGPHLPTSFTFLTLVFTVLSSSLKHLISPP